jgi:hypothetical protein
MEANAKTARPDWLTVAAIAIIVHIVSAFFHEGPGHGGACLAVGCKPQLLTTMQFQGDEQSLSRTAIDFISAGGSIANVIVAAFAILFLRCHRGPAGTAWYFLWLFATDNLLEAAGYPLYSGLANIGDWANIIHGLQPSWLWHVGLAAIGGASYYLVTRWSMGQLGRRLHDTGSREAAARRYTLVSYFAIAAIAILGGIFEPGGAFIVLISAAAASLGGTSGLAWGPQLLQDPRLGAVPEDPVQVHRDPRWIAAAVVLAIIFVAGLGPGVPLHFR